MKMNFNLLLCSGIFFFLINFSICNSVLNLTDKIFEEHKNNHEYILIYFHASYSEESKNLQGHFRKLPRHLSTDKDIIYAIVTQKNFQVNKKYNVEFPYPRIVLVNKDKHWEYKGAIKTNEIVDWVKRKLNRELISVNTREELFDLLNNYEKIILYVGEKENFNKISNLTEIFRDLHFYNVNSLELIKSLNIKEEGKNLDEKIIILKTYDEFINQYKGNINQFDELEKFLRSYAYPLMNNFSPNNYLYVVNNQISFSVMFLPDIIKEEQNELINTIQEEYYKIATKFTGELFFMYGNISDQSQTTLAIDFEIEEKDLPVIIIQQYSKDERLLRRYKVSNKEKKHNIPITEFFDKYKSGSLRRFLKSEKVKHSPYDITENIYHLGRINFFEFLLQQEDMFVLVFFTRRNCGVCIEYKKDFVAVSNNFREKSIKFVIIDGVANEFDEFDVPGFPSLTLFNRGYYIYLFFNSFYL